MNTCDIFGLPRPPTLKDPHKSPACAAWREAVHWEGKDDPRRVFSKRFVYRNNYGGDPATAGDIPGAKQLGLDGPKLVAASNRYLARHPAIARYWGGIRRQVAAKREIRSFLGRRRRLLGKTAKAIRAAYDHPMQGGCTDVFNLTCIAIKERWPFLIWAWGMHDSQYWLCPKAHTAEVMQEFAGNCRTGVGHQWTHDSLYRGVQSARRRRGVDKETAVQLDAQTFLRLVEDTNRLCCFDIEATGLHGDYNSVLVVSIKPYHKAPIVHTVERPARIRNWSSGPWRNWRNTTAGSATTARGTTPGCCARDSWTRG